MNKEYQLKLLERIGKCEKTTVLNIMRTHKEYLDLPGYEMSQIFLELVSEGYLARTEDDVKAYYEITPKGKNLIPTIKSAVREEKYLKIDWSNLIAVGWGHSVGLGASGTVVTIADQIGKFNQCNTHPEWKNLVAVDAGDRFTVGLKIDGTVVALGKDKEGQCNVQNWTDIVAIAAGKDHTVGLKSDGTVVAVGANGCGQCNVQEWADIIAVSCGRNDTIGLKADGTIVSTAYSDNLQEDENWTDIKAIACGESHIVGLKSNGTVVANGINIFGECNVQNWTDIVAIACGYRTTIGLKSNGTVVVVGDNSNGECNVRDWNDIIAVTGGYWTTMGLKSDGTLVAVGSKVAGQCKVQGIKLFKNKEDIEQKRKKMKEEYHKMKEWRSQNLCQYCGGAFKKSLFGQKCEKCGKPLDYTLS